MTCKKLIFQVHPHRCYIRDRSPNRIQLKPHRQSIRAQQAAGFNLSTLPPPKNGFIWSCGHAKTLGTVPFSLARKQFPENKKEISQVLTSNTKPLQHNPHILGSWHSSRRFNRPAGMPPGRPGPLVDSLLEGGVRLGGLPVLLPHLPVTARRILAEKAKTLGEVFAERAGGWGRGGGGGKLVYFGNVNKETHLAVAQMVMVEPSCGGKYGVRKVGRKRGTKLFGSMAAGILTSDVSRKHIEQLKPIPQSPTA